MADMDYVAKFKADFNDFIKNMEAAGKDVDKFNKNIQDTAKKGKTSFMEINAAAELMKKGISIAGSAMEKLKTIAYSTQATQDAWARTAERCTAAMNTFNQTLATGDWTEFIGNMQTAIKLAGDYYNAMDNLGTSKIRSGLQTGYNDMEIARLKAERAGYAKDTDEYRKLTEEIDGYIKENDKQIGLLETRYEDAMNKIASYGVNAENVDHGMLRKYLDETSKEYKKLEAFAERIKEVKKNIVSTGSNIMANSDAPGFVESKSDKFFNELQQLRSNPNPILANADKVTEHSTDFKEFAEIAAQYYATKITQYAKVEAENAKKLKMEKALGKSGTSSGTNEKVNEYVSPEVAKAYKERREELNKLKEAIEQYHEMGMYEGEVEQLVEAYDRKLKEFDPRNYVIEKIEGLKPVEIPVELKPKITPKFVESIKDTVSEIERLNMLKGVFSDMSSSFTSLAASASTLAGENSAMARTYMALAIAGQFAAGAAAILTEARTPGPFVGLRVAATALSIVATIAGFIAQMKGANRYATGGIVAPAAAVGDQTLARVNAGEMILNRNQQTRLFNMIAKGESENLPAGQVEFRLRGTELVGLINNYNRKYSN
jgi:hypothetical protein